jgi:plasmid stabilization system protein ParE
LALVRRLPSFIDDLTDVYAGLAAQSLRAAERLLDDVEATVDLLTVFPELRRLREELRPDVRSFKLRRFPHIVFYRFDGTGVTLLRLLHGARDLGTLL